MIIGFLASELVDVASLAIRGANSLYNYLFSVEQKEVEMNVKLIEQVQKLEDMCSKMAAQRLKDLKMYETQINGLRQQIMSRPTRSLPMKTDE